MINLLCLDYLNKYSDTQRDRTEIFVFFNLFESWCCNREMIVEYGIRIVMVVVA